MKLSGTSKRESRPRGAVYVLTGAHGSGKTLVAAQVVADARARGLDVAGIITGSSSPDPDAPREVVDVRSGQSRLFGAPVTAGLSRAGSGPVGIASGAGSGSDPLTPGWDYDASVFAWANEVLSTATPCDLLVVDEVGPLELLGGRGWVKAIEVLRSRDFKAALVICRPSLVDELENSLGGKPAGVFEADLDDMAALPAALVDQMLG